MRAGARPTQFIFGAAAHDLAAKLDEGFEHLLQGQHAWLAFDNRQIDDAERRLHRRHLIELVQDDLRHRIAFEFDDDPHPFAIRFVTEV